MKQLFTILAIALFAACVPAATVEPEFIQYDTVQPEKVYDTIAPTDKPVDTNLDAVQ